MAITWARELDEYPTGARRRKILSMAVLASLICSYEAAIAPVVPIMLPDLGMTLKEYGLMSAAALFVGAVAGLIGGRLADRIGRVKVLVPLMTLTSFIAFCMIFVDSPTSLVVMRIVLSFIDGMAVATTAPLVRDFSPRMGRGQAMGFWASGPVGANFLSAGIAAATLTAFNNQWHSQFVIIGCISLICSIVIALNIADLSPKLRAEILQTEQRVIDQSDDVAPPTIKTLLREPSVWAHLFGISFFLVFYLTATVYGQAMVVDTFGKTPAEASAVMLSFWVLNIAALILVGRWSDRIQLRRIFSLGFTVLSLAILGVLIMLMGDPTTPTAALSITGALLGGAMGAAYSPWMALMSENSEDIDARLQGTTWGLFNFMVRLITLAVVVSAPIVVEASGGWQAWIMVTAGCMALFLVAMPFFKGPWTAQQRADAAAAPSSDPEELTTV